VNKKQKELFTPESLVEFARERIVVRVLIEQRAVRVTSVSVLCCVDDHMLQLRFGWWGSNECDDARIVAKDYLDSLKNFCGARSESPPQFLFEKVQAAAAIRNGKAPLDVRQVSPSALCLLPVYGQAMAVWNERGYWLHSADRRRDILVPVFRRRMAEFVDQMVDDATRGIRALLG
jgi:hypothetical protein